MNSAFRTITSSETPLVQNAQELISRGSQIRAARALLDWSISDLAAASGVHRNTVGSWESRAKITRRQQLDEQSGPARIAKAIRAAGVQFILDPAPGVCFARQASVALANGTPGGASHDVLP